MKFDLAKSVWTAIHDNKTVYYPNYKDIDRSTLKEFIIQDEDKNKIFSLKGNPLKLFARLRTFGIKTYDSGQKAWIVGNKDPFEFFIIDSDGNSTRHTEWGNIPAHQVEFMESEQ